MQFVRVNEFEFFCPFDFPLQKRLLGPGTYNIPDSFHELSTKPGSKRGFCQTRAQRFQDMGKVNKIE